MLTTTMGRLRLLGDLEGASYLLLLGVAMPLKYMAGMPEAVAIVGRIHGALFVLYVLAIVHATVTRGWPWSRAALGFVAAFLPFGPFVFHRRVLDELPAD